MEFMTKPSLGSLRNYAKFILNPVNYYRMQMELPWPVVVFSLTMLVFQLVSYLHLVHK